MTILATLGPLGSHPWQAAQLYDGGAEILLCNRIREVFAALAAGRADRAVVPIYNTREGEPQDFFRMMTAVADCHWVDNLVLPIHLCLGSLDGHSDLTTITGGVSELKQCEEYIALSFPDADLLATHDVDAAIRRLRREGRADVGVIEAEEILKARNLVVRAREIAAHNRTRFAVFARKPAATSGYDATALITEPLKDRLGLLVDILGEFSRRGINLADLRTDSDIKTQRLQIYIEAEGHIDDEPLAQAIARIERDIVQEPGVVRILGSFPRVDIRAKLIDGFGFIGTGDMSTWFARKLEGEGYRTLLAGRSTVLRPEELIRQVDAVVICVPISATIATVREYGPLLQEGQALILLAGSAENIVNAALDHTREGVEVMLVHNLWGPQAATMKNKTASVVRTRRSGALCSEFEAFLYKHGADILQDSPGRHDLLMGVGQKLPTSISVALARTLRENGITPEDINSHATLTSLYTILHMSRIHAQNDRTYAEIMAAAGAGMGLVRDFIASLSGLLTMAEAGDIAGLQEVMEKNRSYLREDFLRQNMNCALAVDEVISRRRHR
ncbi:MAG: prephenate dehydratase domain-containing protein [Thermodesulfobacteriota bacterium]